MLFQGPKTIKNQEQQKVSGIYVNVVDDYRFQPFSSLLREERLNRHKELTSETLTMLRYLKTLTFDLSIKV